MTKLCSIILLTALCTFSGCFPREAASEQRSPAGFFTGVWHGWIAPLSLIVGFFDNDVRIYDKHNSGWWYDLGYYVAVVGGLGGVAFSRRRKEIVVERS